MIWMLPIAYVMIALSTVYLLEGFPNRIRVFLGALWLPMLMFSIGLALFDAIDDWRDQ